jgi:hypothetical protein
MAELVQDLREQPTQVLPLVRLEQTAPGEFGEVLQERRSRTLSGNHVGDGVGTPRGVQDPRRR